MGNDINRHLQQNSSTVPLNPVDVDLTLLRKIQVIIDSCVGVLQQTNFLDLDSLLTNEQLSDLSHLLYLSFPTQSQGFNDHQPLEPFLFRSSTFSLFGHVIVNQQTFEDYRRKLDKSRQNPILHVITGTAGMGKSASRFPFVTLLMSHGVESATTTQKGEQTFVFKLKNTVETGKAAIYLDNRFDPFPGFETASYVHTYDVFSFKEKGDNEPSDAKLEERIYDPGALSLPKNLSSSNGWTHHGDVSVPSVEYFPYFVRLLVCPETEILHAPRPLSKDIRIFQKSTLASGSILAAGSVLIHDSIYHKQLLSKDIHLKVQMILLAGSTVARHSTIVEYPANTISLFHDGDGTEIRISNQPPNRTHYEQQTILNRNYVLEAGSTLRKGSKVTLKLPRPQKRSPLTKDKTIARPIEIAAGSIITANSVLAAGSSISSTLKVENLLKGKHWDVVDDLTFSKYSTLHEDGNYVLFTSPKSSRWKEINNPQSLNPVTVVEYSVPKYTPQEEAALLNTMGAPTDISENDILRIMRSVELFSFNPRFVLNPEQAKKTIDTIWESDKQIIKISPQDLFNDDISHKMIHFSCPQYDCHNWRTEFATELAKKIILRTFNTAMQEEDAETVLTLTNDRELNQKKEAVFHAFVSDAIVGGLRLASPKRLVTGETLPDNIRLPAPIGESHIHMRNPKSIRKASLPDIKQIPAEKLRDFEEQWGILFSSPMHPCFVSSTKLGGEGDIVAISRPITHHKEIRSSRRQTQNNSNAKCFTFYLKPLGGNNEEVGSILLFFKVHAEQDEWKVDDIAVMFIHSTLAPNSFFSRTMSNLMFVWLALLSTVYGLSQQHIHPFVFFVKLPTFTDFALEGPNTSASFIPTDNVMAIDAHTREVSEDDHALTGQLLLSSVAAVQPNTNPQHFRCSFCGRILTDFFPSHRCPNIRKKHWQISDMRTKDAIWNWENSMLDWRPPQIVQLQTADGSVPQFVFSLVSTPSAGPSTGCEEGQRAVVGIRLAFPHPKCVPNSREGRREFDVMDVEMVCVGEQTTRPLPFALATKEQARRIAWKVIHSDPIPNIFTYFPSRPNNPRPPQPTISPMPGPAFRGTKTRPIVLNEFENRASHLCTSVHLVDVWTNGQRIGFDENKRDDVLSLGALHPPHECPTDLWKSKQVPLAQIHLPMTVFPKQTVLLGTSQILTPFEIRGILSLVDRKDSNDIISRLQRQSIVRECINKGQPLTEDMVQFILSDERVFSLLPASDLVSLQNRLPSLRSLSLYDLQSLVSFVSGTPTFISDILGTIADSLAHPTQPKRQTLEGRTNTVIRTDPTIQQKRKAALASFLSTVGIQSATQDQIQTREINAMLTCLQTSFSVSSRMLREVLEYKLLGKETDLSLADVGMVVEGLKTNPLLPLWRRRHITPFLTEVPKTCEQQMEVLSRLKKTFERKEREICIAILLIHAPIDDSEKTRLTSLITSKPNPFSEIQIELLTTLINENFHDQNDVNEWNKALDSLESEARNIQDDVDELNVALECRESEAKNSQDDVDERNKTLACLEETQNYDELPYSVLQKCIQMSTQVSEIESDILGEAILSAENILGRDRDTLLSLVYRKPRFTSSRRKDIASWCCLNLDPNLEDTLVEQISELKLSDLTKTRMKECVTAKSSVSDKDINFLNNLFKLREYSDEQPHFLDRSEKLSQSDRSLAVSCGIAQSDVAQVLIDELPHFLERNKKLSQSDRSLAVSCGIAQSDVTIILIANLFDHFRGKTFLSDEDLKIIQADIQRFRDCLYLKQIYLIKRLKEANVSWKDLATLLCLPNGDDSTHLPGLDVLCPPATQGSRGRKSERNPQILKNHTSTIKMTTIMPRLPSGSERLMKQKHRPVNSPSLKTKRMDETSDRPPKEPMEGFDSIIPTF
ncbi:hypothetical protein BLNAU_10423 [Blattamonas nauphoetae]|uniref:Uncharacterized protein n=1 Tax=Blattamonas nauphoetae TaxID=2049346 RepID=A0ABQ9XS74_9EUKA|nr:hypothetical protein BLNAU_10423 [Blattamonas nauphoetae]